MNQLKGPHPLERERWLLGEQSEQERARTEARLDASERVHLRAEDEALRARLLATHPPSQLAMRALARARSPRRAPFYIASLAALACATFLLWTPSAEPRRTVEVRTERVKGQAMELRVYRQRAGGAERLRDGTEVAAGELVQLGFLRAGHRYGVLLSIDGGGSVTLHFPRDPTDSTRLPSGSGEQLLAKAYELDDAPLFERFLFVGADEPLVVDAVLDAARRLAGDLQRARVESLRVESASEQRSLLLHKTQAR
jgi:hypothetical protein